MHRHATALRLAPPPARMLRGSPEEELPWLAARCGPLNLARARQDERRMPGLYVDFQYVDFVEMLATARQTILKEPRSQLVYFCNLFLPCGTSKQAAKLRNRRPQPVLDVRAMGRLQVRGGAACGVRSVQVGLAAR